MDNNVEMFENNGLEKEELHFLLIEREIALYCPLINMLEAAGHCVEQLGNGKDALPLLEAKPYSGVVVDVDMNDMDGAEFILKARKIQPELLIFVLTAQPTLRSAVAAIKAGAADYIVKPTDVATINNAILKAIEKKINQRNQLWQMVQNVLHNGSEPQSIADNPPDNTVATRNSIQIVSPIRLDHSRRLVTFTDNPLQVVKLSRGETAILSC